MKVYAVKNMGMGFICKSCRGEFQYPPIQAPCTRLRPVEGKPGLMSAEWLNMCVDCAIRELPVLKEKISRGEVYPLHVWDDLSLVEAIYVTEDGDKFASDVGEKEK